MDLRARGLEKGVEDLARETALKVMETVSERTPVDTGRARAGWRISLGTATGGRPRGEARAVADGFRIGLPGGLFLTNDVEYIVFLENGHSQQAPAGFVRQGLEAGRAFIKSRSGTIFRAV